jgi:hypothetical protein
LRRGKQSGGRSEEKNAGATSRFLVKKHHRITLTPENRERFRRSSAIEKSEAGVSSGRRNPFDSGATSPRRSLMSRRHYSLVWLALGIAVLASAQEHEGRSLASLGMIGRGSDDREERILAR